MIGRLMSTLRKIPMKLNEGISKVFIDEKITTIVGGFIIIGILCIWGMTAQPQNYVLLTHIVYHGFPDTSGCSFLDDLSVIITDYPQAGNTIHTPTTVVLTQIPKTFFSHLPNNPTEVLLYLRHHTHLLVTLSFTILPLPALSSTSSP